MMCYVLQKSPDKKMNSSQDNYTEGKLNNVLSYIVQLLQYKKISLKIKLPLKLCLF
jgi:hypothetical protein